MVVRVEGEKNSSGFYAGGRELSSTGTAYLRGLVPTSNHNSNKRHNTTDNSCL